MQDVEGKVAVITGGASGIGLATAQRFAAAGMRIVLADVETTALDRAAANLKAGDTEVLAVPTDVTSEEAVHKLADTAFARFGAVHVVFNNAGVAATAATLRARAWEGPLADWDWTMAVNFMGVLYGVRAFVPRMLDAGEDGHIVNTASIAGLVSGANPYNVSKHAVVCLTEGMFKDFKEMGAKLSASVVCPGLINTNILDSERNRPADYGAKTELSSLRSDVQAFAAGFKTALENGYPPSVVADQVLEGILADQFYILPAQAPLLDVVNDRMQGIIDQRNPTQR